MRYRYHVGFGGVVDYEPDDLGDPMKNVLDVENIIKGSFHIALQHGVKIDSVNVNVDEIQEVRDASGV